SPDGRDRRRTGGRGQHSGPGEPPRGNRRVARRSSDRHGARRGRTGGIQSDHDRGCGLRRRLVSRLLHRPEGAGKMTSTILLLGDHVSSSLSPGFQQAAFMALGIDCTYVAREVPPAGLAAVIEEIRADDRILGANVTIPHKEAVIALLDDLDPLARKVGAVNTISRQGTRLKGWNTDVEGFQRALHEHFPSPADGGGQGGGREPFPSPARGGGQGGGREPFPSPARGGGRGGGRHIAIIGAGGAARAVAAALQPMAEQIWVIARNPDQARRLCADLDIVRGGPVGMGNMRETIAGADLVVNATPTDLPPDGWLRPDQRLFDLRSRRAPEGRAMLLYQGAASFEIWTGRPAPLLVMRTTLERSVQSVSA